MKGLLLAGGHGTRLRPLTFTGNKHMIPVANRPILLYGLDHLRQAGIEEIGIVLGPIQEGIREVIGDGSQWGLRVSYIHQGEPKGLAHAVLCAREFLGDDPFVMYLGDNLLQEGVRPFVRAYEASHPDAIVGATPVADPRRYGVIELDGERIVSVEEKPAQPRSDLALVGVYLFTRKIVPVIEQLKPSKRGELEITDAIRGLLAQGGHVRAQRVGGWWKDTGLPADLIEANNLVLSTRPVKDFRIWGSTEPGAKISGAVEIGENSRVAAGAEITGPAIIGKDVTIGPGTRIGPGSAIGDGSTLSGCSVRSSIVLERAAIEGPLKLADSIVGRDVTLKARTARSDEAQIIVGDAARLLL